MDRIRKTVDEAIRAMQRAPPNVSKRLKKLLRKFYKFLKENPEISERALPILLRLRADILKGDYAGAVGQLCLLLVLINLRKRKK